MNTRHMKKDCGVPLGEVVELESGRWNEEKGVKGELDDGRDEEDAARRSSSFACEMSVAFPHFTPMCEAECTHPYLVLALASGWITSSSARNHPLQGCLKKEEQQ